MQPFIWSEIPQLFRKLIPPIDVALIHVSPPYPHKGTCQKISESKNSGSVLGISDLSFTVPAESLKSETKAINLVSSPGHGCHLNLVIPI